MSEAVMKTSEGEITFELFDEDAPKTVSNFKELAGQGFYDGLIFHRIIPDFMIQGGCPEGTGTGGPGYKFEDEINDHKVVRGALAMANAGPNTNGSQFFIVTADECPWLDGKHTVFGQVTGGQDVVERIGSTQTDGRDRPVEPIGIETVTFAQLGHERRPAAGAPSRRAAESSSSRSTRSTPRAAAAMRRARRRPARAARTRARARRAARRGGPRSRPQTGRRCPRPHSNSP